VLEVLRTSSAAAVAPAVQPHIIIST
jgi:hypothetical protein